MKHKKQHFVPTCYLKAWCDTNTDIKETPYVWMYPRSGGEPRRKSPEKIFKETDFYTIGNGKGVRDLRLEHRLNKIETKFTGIRKSFEKRREISDEEHILLCLFVSAMKARTKAYRDFQADQWRKPLEMMEDMIKWHKTASPEDKKKLYDFRSPLSDNNAPKLYYEDVKRFVEKPMQSILLPTVRAMAPLLIDLDIAVLETEMLPGFITSDDPCVWHDPEGYKRAPLYSGPALMYKTIEITLPISPKQLLLINRQGVEGYINIPDTYVDAMNARTRYFSSEHFIVCKNIIKDSWFEGEANGIE